MLGKPEDVAAELREAAGAPGGFEVVIDCAGFQQTMQASAGLSGAAEQLRDGNLLESNCGAWSSRR